MTRNLSLVFFVLLAAAPAAARAQESTPVPETPEIASQRSRYAERLQRRFLLERERDLKNLQIELAAEEAPYLLLDLADLKLQILVRATVVKSFALRGAEIEGERSAFSAEVPPPDWARGIFILAGKSGPPREAQKIEPASPGAEAAADPRSVTPDLLGLDGPSDEPSHYTLLFQEGLAVSLGGSDENATPGWVERNLQRLKAVIITPELPRLPGSPAPHVWIHLDLPAEQARALYPSLFVEMRAFVRLPGDPRL